MKKHIVQIFAVIMLTAMITACNTGTDTASIPLKNHDDTVSYVIGAEYATVLLSNGYTVKPEAFYKGFDMALKGRDNFPDSIKLVIIEQINQENQLKQQEQMLAFVQQNKELGAQFLAQNKKREGVEELPNGLQFRILKKGSGPSPLPNDSVLIHYKAMFIDGTAFDETYQRGPQVAYVNSVVPGLSEGLQLMNKGSIFEIYLPWNLAYGERGVTNVIPGGVAIIYSVELIEIY